MGWSSCSGKACDDGRGCIAGLGETHTLPGRRGKPVLEALIGNGNLPEREQLLARIAHAEWVRQTGEIQTARTLFEELLESPGMPLDRRAQCLGSLGIVLIQLGDYVRAAERFDEAETLVNSPLGIAEKFTRGNPTAFCFLVSFKRRLK